MSEIGYIKSFDKDLITSERDEEGVYEIMNEIGEVIYVGAGPIKDMLSGHFPDGTRPLTDAKFYRTFSGGPLNNLEMRRKMLLDDYQAIRGFLPKYNRF